jgi:uncharacterized XkdX family phage protein
MHSPSYERIKENYDKGWVTLAQLKKYVQLGVITEEEYTEICGGSYPTA